ncbi:MAG: hypothetical protein LQ352_008308 [Teloschistes flavicans]|nr:MAG: hypothetical protein LQ352_008308 [Teloschistes flavicans]
MNVLIMLHGLGDTKESFAKLAGQMQLPETVSISVQGPQPLPFGLGGFAWGDDFTFSESSGTMDYDTGFERSSRIIKEEIIEKALIQSCGYKPRNILLFGFGQGGMAALASSIALETELGGVVSIGGPQPSSISSHGDGTPKNQTPILVLGGSSNTLIHQSALTHLKKAFHHVEYVKWSRSGDSMPRSTEEMKPIMKFFARRLQSRSGIPEDATELG